MKIFHQVLQAIAFCHKNQIIHRDIKLDNILISETYKVKLIDFGFSVQTPDDKKLSMFCGTPKYMSP